MRPALLIRLSLLTFAIGVHAGCQDSCDPPPDETPTPEPEATPAPLQGSWVDLALDSNGRPWVAMRNLDTTALTIGRGDGDPAEFTFWSVDGQGEVQGGLLVGNFDGGHFASIEIDSTGRAHAAHYDAEDGRLRYVFGDGDTWTQETASSAGGQFASLGLVGDEAIIAWYDEPRGDLKVSMRQAGSWSTETIDDGTPASEGRDSHDDDDSANPGDDDDSANPPADDDDATDPPPAEADVGKYADLLVDGSGTVWIAYYDATNGDLKMASGSFGNWTVETWASEGDVGIWPDVAADGSSVYVSYGDVENRDLLLGSWSGNTLSSEVVDGGDFVGADSALTFVGGEPVVMYHDGVNNDAIFGSRASGAWTLTTWMGDGAVGFHNNLVPGTDGRLNWAAYDRTRHELIFQRFEP